jgi:MFS family permease
VGAVIALAGAFVLLAGPAGPADWPVFVAGTALVGVGSGMFAPSINAVAMGSVEPAFAGLGSGVLNTSRQIGMAVGVGLLGGFIALADPEWGMRIGVGFVAVCFLAILVLALRFAPGPTRGPVVQQAPAAQRTRGRWPVPPRRRRRAPPGWRPSR